MSGHELNPSVDCFHCQIICGGSRKARSLFRVLNIGSFSKTAEIVNRRHLIQEPPQGGKQQNNLGMPDGKRIAPYENILMLFPFKLFLS
jgi:hypothetical protein